MKVKQGDYQKQSRKTWGLVNVEGPLAYPAMGMANEAGEFLGKLKKLYRDKEGKISSKDREDLLYELGDVLWYLTQLCTELDSTLEEIGEKNLDKLFSRLDRNQLGGSGDHR